MQFIPIIERLPAPRVDVPLAELGLAPGLAQAAPWKSWRDRPLYRQEGALVTDRSVTAEQYGTFLIGRLRGVGPPRRRRGLRADVRRRPGQLVRRAAVAVHPFRDLRHRPGAGAQRRPLLLRPLRGAGATGSATSPRRRWWSWWRPSSSAASGWTSATRCRATAGSATCGSPATAAARRTASSRRPTASPGSTTCAPATRPSSTTSTGPMRMMSELLRQGRAPSELVAAVCGGGRARPGRGCAGRPQRSLPVRQRAQVQALSRRRRLTD